MHPIIKAYALRNHAEWLLIRANRQKWSKISIWALERAIIRHQELLSDLLEGFPG